MCPTELDGEKLQLSHCMVRFHQREATSVAPNGSSQRNTVSVPVKKPGAKYRDKITISSIGRAIASNGSS